MNTVHTGLFVSWEKNSLLIKPVQEILVKNYLTVAKFGPRLANNTCEIILVAKQCDSFNIPGAKRLVEEYLKMIGESKQNDLSPKKPEIIHLDVDEDVSCIVLDDSVTSGGEHSTTVTVSSSINSPCMSETNSRKRKNPFEDEHIPVVEIVDDDDVIVLDDSFTDPNIFKKNSKNENLVDLTDIRYPPIGLVQTNKSSQINGRHINLNECPERRANGLSTPNKSQFKKSKLSSLFSRTKTTVNKVGHYLMNVPTSNTSKFDPSLNNINTSRFSNPCTSTSTATASTLKQATGNFPRKKSRLAYKRPAHLVGPLTKNSCNTNVDSQSNIYNPNSEREKRTGFRPIVIDGNNVAISHGRGEFSLKGLEICINFFEKRGHREVRAFLPHYRVNKHTYHRLQQLERQGTVVITPSRKLNDKVIASYDDRFIVQYANEVGGVIVSSDNYRDLLEENPSWAEAIQQRLLMFSWVGDILMFPKDPLGRQGPTLDEFLSFPG